MENPVGDIDISLDTSPHKYTQVDNEPEPAMWLDKFPDISKIIPGKKN
jgi:hypothetical protein